MEKMTNVKALNFVLTNCEIPQEVADKLTAMKASFEKKSNAERKPTPTQLENKGHKEVILSLLADGNQYTISDLMKQIPALSDLSNQRVSAIVRQLVADGAVERIEDKRKAYFKLAE